MKTTELINISHNTQNNDIALAIIVGSLLVVCALKYIFPKNINTLNNKTEYFGFVDDNTVIFSLIINLLVIILISTLTVDQFNSNVIFFGYILNFPTKIALCTIIISTILVIKLLIEMAYYKSFYTEVKMSFFMKTSSYVNARSLVIMLLGSFLYFFSAIDKEIILLTCFVLLCINRLWEMYFRYSKQITANKSIWYYNILYLCILEILPVMVLLKLIIFGKVI